MPLADSARYSEIRYTYCFNVLSDFLQHKLECFSSNLYMCHRTRLASNISYSWKDHDNILTHGSHKRVPWYVESISVYVDMWHVILDQACLVADSGCYDLLHSLTLPQIVVQDTIQMSLN
jgi:hypothetical protein